ncbi:hypothetical protein GQ472_01845 [archaeon]|nr:hypothetical protein [archaeon]
MAEDDKAEEGEMTALRYAGQDRERQLWLTAEQTENLKSFMAQDHVYSADGTCHVRYVADFGTLYISPVNRCGSFMFLGTKRHRDDLCQREIVQRDTELRDAIIKAESILKANIIDADKAFKAGLITDDQKYMLIRICQKEVDILKKRAMVLNIDIGGK